MDGNQEVKAKQAANFFHKHPGFTRLFRSLERKYRSLGRIGGNVVLQKLSVEERQALSSFLRINLEGKDSLTVSFSQFEAVLGETRFGEVDVIALLKAYCGGDLSTREEERVAAEMARQAFFSTLRTGVSEPISLLWLTQVEAKAPGTKRAQGVYEQGSPANLVSFQMIVSALGRLPTEYMRLPLFAYQIMGQPHGFDGDTVVGRMFLEALRLICPESVEGGEGVTAVEMEAELLYHFKLLRDDLLNFVTCAGIFAFYQQEENKETLYWRQAWEDGAVLNVPLRELVKYAALLPACNDHKNREKKVFIVENSGVFSALVDQAAGQGNSLPPLVCLHGQFKLASWVALDRLVAGGCTLYYSGDFDPEGLLMAQRLIKRYPGVARLWHYSAIDYNLSLSSRGPAYHSESTSDSRIKQLDGLIIPELCAIADALRAKRYAGYQEALIEQLADDYAACLVEE